MRSTARFAAIVSLTLVLGGGAWAQDQPSVPAVEAITPHKLDLANQLIDASGAKDQIKNTFHALTGQITGNLGADQSAEDRSRMQVFMDALGDAFSKHFPEFQGAMARAYAETYSEQELSDILTFYKSPSGSALATKAPQLAQESLGGYFKLLPEIMRDAGEEVCAKTTCTAAQKAAFFGKTPPKP